MKKITAMQLILLIAVQWLLAVPVLAEEYPPFPEHNQKHYVIYREGYRNNRIEVVFFDIRNEEYTLKENENKLVWDEELQLWNNRYYKNDSKWYLDGSEWVFFEENQHCISNNATEIISSDLEVIDIRQNGLDPRIEVISKTPHSESQQWGRVWDGTRFVRFQDHPKDGSDINYDIAYSEDGFNYNTVPITVDIIRPRDIVRAGNLYVLFDQDQILFPEWKRNENYCDSPAYILDENFNVIDQVEYEGSLDYICSIDDWFYLKHSDYSQVTLRGGGFIGAIYRYYKTNNGKDWIEITYDDVAEAQKIAASHQNTLTNCNLGLSPEDGGYYLRPQNNLEKRYWLRYEWNCENVRKVGSGQLNVYSLLYGYGERTYKNEGDQYATATGRSRRIISLDGLYGIELPEEVHPNNVWTANDYIYIDVNRNEYYRIPISAFPNNIIVRCQDKILGFEQPPVMEDDRTLVPMRFLFEQLGADVDWNQETMTATATLGNQAVAFSIDDTGASVNSAPITMDVPARLINDKTMVPLRFLSENLGYTVSWDGENRIATIE